MQLGLKKEKNRSLSFLRLGDRAFTLVEVMVAMALAGMVSLAITQLMMKVSDGARSMSALMNAQDLVLTVNTTIRDRSAASFTLGVPNGAIQIAGTSPGSNPGLDISGATPAAPLNLTNIYDSNYNVVLSTVAPKNVIGSGGSQLKITKITYNNVGPGPLNTNGSNPGNISVSYQGIYGTAGAPGGGSTASKKDFPINVLLRAGSTRVFLALGVDTSLSYICGYYGGVFDPATNKCKTVALGVAPAGSFAADSSCMGVGCTATAAPSLCLGTIAGAPNCVTNLPSNFQCPLATPHVIGFWPSGAVRCGL